MGFRLWHRFCPGVQADIQLLREGQAGKMTIAGANIQDRSRQFVLLIVACFYRPQNGPEAFRWTAEGGILGLGDLPGGPVFSEGLGVSADGLVVVGKSQSSSGTEAPAPMAAKDRVTLT